MVVGADTSPGAPRAAAAATAQHAALARALATARNPFELLAPRYARRPRLFVREVLGATPDAWQDDFLAALERGETRISIRSGHGVGKSTALSWAICWFAATRYPFKCVVTAPTTGQLYDALWAELLTWVRKLPEQWRALWSITSDRIEHKAVPEEAFVTARTSRRETPEAIQGVHSTHVMIVADEASGIPEEVFEAGSGSMSTRGAITILASNPTRATGFFARTHTLERAHWWTRHVSSIESPRVDPKFVEEIKRRYGGESRQYRVRVLGEFPLTDEDTFIALDLVEAAWTRIVHPDPGELEIWGLDPARLGSDASALTRRRGPLVAVPPVRWHGLETMQLVGRVMELWLRQPDDDKPAIVAVDAIGIGAGVADRLRELDVPVAAVNVAEVPSTTGRYARLRDELWDRCREWLQERRCALPADERLRDELCAPRYDYLSSGVLKIESKDEMRRRLPSLGSPDAADSLNLTFVPRVTYAGTARSGTWRTPLRRRIQGIT